MKFFVKFTLLFILPIAFGIPAFLVGTAGIGGGLRELLGLGPVASAAMMPIGLLLWILPTFLLGQVSQVMKKDGEYWIGEHRFGANDVRERARFLGVRFLSAKGLPVVAFYR